jgi:hypothetical protein
LDLKTKSFNGHFTTFHRNGLHEVITKVEKNEICGHFILLHNHAFVNTTCYFNKNIPYGNFRKYYRNGKTEIEAHFNTCGKLDGDFKYFYPNGELMFQSKFSDGCCLQVLKSAGGQNWSQTTNHQLCHELISIVRCHLDFACKTLIDPITPTPPDDENCTDFDDIELDQRLFRLYSDFRLIGLIDHQ